MPHPIALAAVLSAASFLQAPETRAASPAPSGDALFEGTFFRGEGDARYLELLEASRRMFDADPELQNAAMLYTPAWNGFVEGPTWGAWWIQNSYGTTYCALPFLTEPYETFLQNAQDLWFDHMGDGKRVFKWREFEWLVPDGQLCDAAAPGWVVPKQGDGRVDIHDWGVEFTAAGLLMQAEALLIRRDPVATGRYLPMLERCADFLETRRDPSNDLFLAGPAGNLLAPSYAGWRRPDGAFEKAYLAGLSVTYIAALDRLVELEKLAGKAREATLYAERRDRARRGLPLLTTEEGYFIKSLDPDGTRHGVHGAERHGYFEAVVNHDAICFRVADDRQAERIYAKLASIPELRRHDVIVTNHPSLDDMYVPDTDWLWKHGTWVNGGHWSTCEARMVMAYYRLGKHEDARRSMEHLMKFARSFRLDNPLVDFGNAVYQPGEAINLCYDSLGPPAAMIRGLFEYLYTAEGLTLVPHVPPGIRLLEQRFPIRLGTKRLHLATYGTGPIASVLVDGKPWRRHDSRSVVLPHDELPEESSVQIVLGDSEALPFDVPRQEGELPAPRAERKESWYANRLSPMTANDRPLRIGADSNGESRFRGDIARARVFARALSAEEVRALAGQTADGTGKDDALIVDLRFDDRKDDAFANAASETLPARVVGEIQTVDSPGGKALRLDGRGYLEIPDDPRLDLTRACTLEAWIAPAEIPEGGGRIIDKTTVGASDGYLLDTYPRNALRVISERGSIGHAAGFAPGRWAHIAATIAEDGSLALYVDGKPVASEKRETPPELAGLRERVEMMWELHRRLGEAGLGGSYEAEHARLAVRCYEAFHRRLDLEAEGRITALPQRSALAADLSYVSTTRKLCEGLAATLGTYGKSDDTRRRRIHEIWSEVCEEKP